MKSIEVITERIKVLKERIEYFRNEYDRRDANDSQGQLHAIEQISMAIHEIISLENLKKELEK